MNIDALPHHKQELNILLADDDMDDCMFFKEALEGLPLSTKLSITNDGEQLMQSLLHSTSNIPDILFLDLNMPRINGFACLNEIKNSDVLKSIPVVILSTSYEKRIAEELYKSGAQCYICKPNDFSQLKKVIHQALDLILNNKDKQHQPTQQERFFTL